MLSPRRWHESCCMDLLRRLTKQCTHNVPWGWGVTMISEGKRQLSLGKHLAGSALQCSLPAAAPYRSTAGWSCRTWRSSRRSTAPSTSRTGSRSSPSTSCSRYVRHMPYQCIWLSARPLTPVFPAPAPHPSAAPSSTRSMTGRCPSSPDKSHNPHLKCCHKRCPCGFHEAALWSSRGPVPLRSYVVSPTFTHLAATNCFPLTCDCTHTLLQT